jgi:predicted ferric reductase
MSDEEAIRVKQNQQVIREYLIGQFKWFELTEKPDGPRSHTFTVTKSSDEQYKLKASWPQLSDKSNTSERTKQRLVTDDVAGRLKGKSQGEYFSWGKH